MQSNDAQHSHTPSGRFTSYPTQQPTVISPKRNNSTMMLLTLSVAGVIALVAMTAQLLGPSDQETATAAPQPAPSPSSSSPTREQTGAAASPAPLESAGSTLAALLEQSLDDQAVTRAEPFDLLTPTGPIVAVPAGLTPEPSPAAPSQIVDSLQTAVGAAEEALLAERHTLGLYMRMLKEGALAGVYTFDVREEGANKRVLYRPSNMEKGGIFIKTLLREALEKGEITFPAGLSTENGEVDLDSTLFHLVQDALLRDGSQGAKEAAQTMSRRAVEAAGTRQPQLREVTSYTVQPGDSLALIALKFYGQVGGFERIYEANRAILSSPDRIRVGQRLIIPG